MSQENTKTSTIAILFAGMLIGGFVMFLLFLSKIDLSQENQITKEARAASREKTKPTPDISTDKQSESKFDFYQMLPEIEVSIDSKPDSIDAHSKGLSRHQSQASDDSLFYLQVGAFSEYQGANKHKANLLLNNFPTQVQKGKNSVGKTLFKVYVGPYSEGTPLDTAMKKLEELGLKPYKLRL